MRVSRILVSTVAVTLFAALPAFAADPNLNDPHQNPNMQATPQHQMTTTDRADKTIPSKKIVGANVENAAGEKIAAVEDLVIDLQSGKVTYAALSVGGVLGIGEKYVAVPFEDLRKTYDKSGNLIAVLDISKERLEQAPTFDKDHWSDFSNPQWRTKVDTYYRTSAASRPTTEQPMQNR